MTDETKNPDIEAQDDDVIKEMPVKTLEEEQNGAADEAVEATAWSEVFTACCVHTPRAWLSIFLYLLAILFFLYWFIFALEMLGTGAKVLTGCMAGGLFGNTNPVASLIIGMLVTVLLQSSSTTTSIIVSMVGGGAIPVGPAIYMVMGANIGTSVTNTIVAMGQLGDGDELERAFAGATVHDMFNFLSVAILFIVELITKYLERLTQAITKNYEPAGEGDTSEGIKVIISPILDRILKANSNVMKDIATGKVESCSAYYPTECYEGIISYQNCVKEGRVGLITCSKEYGCPAFFNDGATQREDTVAGGACLVIGIIVLMICLAGLVTVLKNALFGASERIIHKATSFNGYISMAIGCALTIAVQSSSVTTSVLTPLVGVGLVSVQQMYPFTLGANIGTTVTGILAAAVASTADAMQVALAHFFFNVTGILIWYPIPFMRRIPIGLALRLGTATRWWRGFPFLYIAVAFFLIPILLLGISSLFADTSKKGNITFGSLIVIFVVLGIVKFAWYWYREDGAAKTQAMFQHRQKRNEVFEEIIDEFRPLKEDVFNLKRHTGLPEDEVEGNLENPKNTSDRTGKTDESNDEDKTEEKNIEGFEPPSSIRMSELTHVST